MSRKIIGVTVGTPISPARLDRELKPVKTVNGVAPDVDGNADIPVGEKIIDLSDEFGLGYIEMEALNNDDLLLGCLQSKSFQFTAGDLGLDMAFLNVEKLPIVVVTGYNDSATIHKHIKVVSADVGAESPVDSYVPTVVLTADLSSDNYLRISQQFISGEYDDGYYTMENFTPINDATFSLVPKAQKMSDNVQLANALKGSAVGEVVALKDVSPLEHGLGVRVSSKNLISSDIWDDLFDKQEDGSYLSNKEIRADASLRQFYLPPAVYTISYDVKCEIDKNYRIRIIYEDDSYLDSYVRPTGDYVHYETVTAEKAIKAIQWYYSDLSQNVYFKNLQIEKGTTATAYTPFVPDIGAVKIKAQGANIINITEMLNNQLVDNGDGTYTITKNGEGGLRIANYANINIPKGTKVAANIDFIEIGMEPTEPVLGIQFMTDDGNEDVTIGLVPGDVPRNFCFPTENLIKARFFLSSEKKDGDYVKFKNFQLEYGTAATEYEPYIEPVEYAVSADGTVEGVKSIYPATTLTTDTVGALIEVEYNKDANKVVATLEERIATLEAAIVSQ